MKFIFVSGGVISGLGKGITASSIGLLLKSRGINVTAMKCDMYLNIDAGTMNPAVHGEVFVTHDGLETDQDLGHYERFLNITLSRENYLTNGQIYKDVLEKERALEFNGLCVQPYHHIPPEIINKWFEAGKKNNSDVIIIELGGTVGEYEGLLFFEAIRRLKLQKPDDVCLIHVVYLPVPASIGELKSKPAQQSITILNSIGLQPDFVIARAEKKIDDQRKEKISLPTGIPVENIFSNPDVQCIYEVPVLLQEQKIAEKIAKFLKLKLKKKDMKKWIKFVEKSKKLKIKKRIAIIGKYQKTGDYILSDSYVCVVEAIKHASWKLGVNSEIVWIDSENLENKSIVEVKKLLTNIDGIIVPQGWGKRGVEGKIKAVEYARRNNISFLGLCFGMQMAIIEFARNVAKLKNSNSEEVDEETKHKVIHIMPNQKEYLENKQYGGTIRLGAWPTVLKENSIIKNSYQKYGNKKNSPWYVKNQTLINAVDPQIGEIVYERHRHRYEFNKKYQLLYEKMGMLISGTSPDKKLVEAIELKNHKYFVGTQFHPEYLSRPLSPHPIFLSFIESLKK